MDPERFKLVQELFERALALDGNERAVFLDETTDGDGELRREVESLLAADGASADFMEQPAVPDGIDVARLVAADGAGERLVDRYRLLRKIGEGGMSEVFLAVRADDEYQKRVALKIIRHDMDREDLLRRFRTERQILAGLDHPNITRLLDGGTTEEGLPYFVMEYTDGIPIDQFCDDRRLSVRERLELFRVVCSAVQYAHQNLVVHRDIKASNILVGTDGTPKLLDFGIAKLLKPDQFAGQVEYTATWMRPMTPRYASPEQIQGRPVTTSSDVYSLGVLLYKLLTGHLPYRFEDRPPSEMGRLVVEHEPERPSTSVGRVETDPTARDPTVGEITPELVSRARRTQPQQLRRQLAGDPDNILLMALRKEPQRRYASVEQFSDDIRRHLVGLPVLARADTLGYRTTKFLNRNRWPVAAAAAFVLLLAGFAVSMAFQAQRVALERDQARRERDRAEQVVAFLEDIFEVSDPFAASGEDIAAREILERGAVRVEQELGDQPETQATLMSSIGAVYSGLGLFDRAEPLLRRALDTRRRLLDEGDPAIAESRDKLGAMLQARGEFDEAEPLLRVALAERREAFGELHPTVAESSYHLAKVLQSQGRYEEAERLYSEALRIHQATGGDELELARMQGGLAILFSEMGDFEAAEAGFREALRIRRLVLGNNHALVAEAVNDLAVCLGIQGKYDDAEPRFREALEIRRRLLGDEHPAVAEGLNNLGRLLKEKREFDEAERLYREALWIHRKRLGEDHPRVPLQLYNLAHLLQAKGDPAPAEGLHREALAARRRILGDEHADTGHSLASLGSVLVDLGRPAEAEPLLEEAIAVYAVALPEGHWRVGVAQSHLGRSLAAAGRPAEAEAQLVAGCENLERALGFEHSRTVVAVEHLIEFYDSVGRTEEAARYRARLNE